jgi:hypothetical protein
MGYLQPAFYRPLQRISTGVVYMRHHFPRVSPAAIKIKPAKGGFAT